MGKQLKEQDLLNIRTEYSALSSFYSSVVGYRFTLLGFFIAAIGLISREGITLDKAYLLLLLTIGMYMIELRNRVLYTETSHRGMQIEREYWGYTGSEAYSPFYSSLLKVKPTYDKDPNAGKPIQVHYPKVWCWIFNFKISHTFGLDIIYWSTAFYCIYYILKSFFPSLFTLIHFFCQFGC